MDADEDFDTIQAVIFNDKYYDAPDDTILSLLSSVQQTPDTFNPFSHLEVGFSSSCYILSPIDKEEGNLETTNKQVEKIKKESCINGAVTTQQSNNSVPSITITITGNTNNAELLQSTVMTEILKSLEFSKLQSNNDENDNLDPDSLDKVSEISEKLCENVTPACEESIDGDCFSADINVNELQQNNIGQNYLRESFSSVFSDHKSHDDSSNDELSDVPKETDLLFEDIVGKLMEDPKHVAETTVKKSLDDEITNSISESDKEPLSKSLETLSYDDLIKYNDSHGTCLDFFQDQCEFESGDDSLRRLEEIRFKIPTPDNSSENADSLDMLNITENSKDTNASNVQVSKISDNVILFDYTKLKKGSSPTLVEESRLDNQSTVMQVPSMEPSPFNVNIQDMQVVFDVPVESESNQLKRHLQNTLNSNAIEFFVIPNDDEADSLGSTEKSPKQVDFEEVARVPAVLELIGATCEARSNSEEGRLLENSVTNLDDYSNR